MKGLPRRIALHQSLVVRQRVVVEEETRCDVKSDEHINGVVLVSGQDEENSEHVHDPRQDVQQVQTA